MAMGLLLAGTAQAAIQTKTVTNSGQGPTGYAAVSLFDPALGKLLSVYAEASYTSYLHYISYVPPVGYDHAVSGTATLGSLTFTINGTSQTSQIGMFDGLFTVTANGSALWTNPNDMALFAGTSGSILGYAGASPDAPGTLVPGNYVPTVNYKLTYTYDNSPAVPEPATWAMMVGGFVLMGVALRAARRGRTVAKPSEV